MSVVIEQSLYIPSGLSFNMISETGLYISSRPTFFLLKPKNFCSKYVILSWSYVFDAQVEKERWH